MRTSRRFLGRVNFNDALEAQRLAVDAIERGGHGVLLGFESEPVVTLGLRAKAEDLLDVRVPTIRVDRGGRATLHHPGQLVIFPICRMSDWGSRGWVDQLIAVTQDLAAQLGHELAWREDAPGLYDDRGKVVAIGLRIRRGISTHGLSINVRNDVRDYAQIRACGSAQPSIAHLRTDLNLNELFGRWTDVFTEHCARGSARTFVGV